MMISRKIPCDSVLMSLFVSPASLTAFQLLFQTLSYGYILFVGSNYISDGSELLLLVPSLSGIVGSVVLPVLGAIPDGMMIIFSCLSADAETVSVGVGALAGSTVMLLTVPWFLAVLGGRVNLNNNKAVYSAADARAAGMDQWLPNRKLNPAHFFSWRETGVGVSSLVARNAKFMLTSFCLYITVQFPAVFFGIDSFAVRICAGFGSLMCTLVFCYYLKSQNKQSEKSDGVVEEMVTEKIFSAIRAGDISFRGAMDEFVRGPARRNDQEYFLLDDQVNVKRTIGDVLSHFFALFDLNKDGVISFDEFRSLMRELKDHITIEEMHSIFNEADSNNSGVLEFDEFVEMMTSYVRNQGRNRRGSALSDVSMKSNYHSEISSDEMPDVPEDLASLPPSEQQFRIKTRAAGMLFFGMALVTLFSDPAVEVVSEIGTRTGISAFYVSFVLAPLASNSSELIAAYNYAQKKTRKSMTVALSSLEGAAIMNNTFCLGIFLALVALKGIPWSYFPQVAGIAFVELVVGLFAIRKQTHRMIDALVILLMYPISLIIVYALQN